MQFKLIIVMLFILFKSTMINIVVCKKNNHLLHDLFQQGKSFLSRSADKWKFSESDTSGFYPEHRFEYQGLEIPEDPFPQGQSLNRKQPQVSEGKNKNNAFILYRTEIIENDNMDLYSLIGGISFASLLLTTLYVLGRNRRNANASFAKSINELARTTSNSDLQQHNYNLTMLDSVREITTRFLTPPVGKLKRFKKKRVN